MYIACEARSFVGVPPFPPPVLAEVWLTQDGEEESMSLGRQGPDLRQATAQQKASRCDKNDVWCWMICVVYKSIDRQTKYVPYFEYKNWWLTDTWVKNAQSSFQSEFDAIWLTSHVLFRWGAATSLSSVSFARKMFSKACVVSLQTRSSASELISGSLSVPRCRLRWQGTMGKVRGKWLDPYMYIYICIYVYLYILYSISYYIYNTILYYIILHCIILYSIIFIILYCSNRILYNIILYYISYYGNRQNYGKKKRST
jgi:hypothetical protein